MSSRTGSLLSNASALFAIQIANYVLPFLLIPYLTRVLGVSLYGVVAFGLAIVQIACVLTDYGFSLSATFQVAKHSNDKTTLRRIISSVMLCKLGLLIPVILLLCIFIEIQNKYTQYNLFLWLLLLPILGQSLQPIWFFQGIERMTFITIYTVISRILYLGLVIIWVSTPAEYYWVAVANGVASIVAATVGISMMLRLGYWPIWGGWSHLRKTFVDSTEFFWSRAAVATYTAGGAVFLGLASNPMQVAYYSAAEQLYKGAQSLFGPVSQALYPYMAKNRDFPLFFKIFKLAIALCLIGVIVGIFISPWVITMIFGEAFKGSHVILIVFMITFAITTPSTLLGYPFLGALGDNKSANLSVMYAGILQIIILFALYLTGKHEAVSVALSVLGVEFFVLLYRAKKSHRILTSQYKP